MVLKEIRKCGIVGCALALAACGGSSARHDPWIEKEPGRYLDVQGLRYQSGAINDLTGPAGEFNWELTYPVCDANAPACKPHPSGPTVFFIMRDVQLPGDASPYTLPWGLTQDPATEGPSALYQTVFASPNSSSSDPVVRQNVKSALLMLDSDGDPTNGIQIPASVVNGTFGADVNWASTNPEQDFAQLVSVVRSLDPGGKHNWPTDVASATHFDARWQCAMVGGYSATLTGQHYTDTNGIAQTFYGTMSAAVMPQGVSGVVQFSSMPFEFAGEFRFNGSLVGDATPTLTTQAVQYVDGGEFAPPASPQLQPPLAITLTTSGVVANTNVQVPTWSGGGYTGGTYLSFMRMEMSTTNNNTTVRQPFVRAIYRFLVSPIWVVNSTTIVRKLLFLEADAAGNVWAVLIGGSGTSSVVIGKTGTDGSINIQNTGASYPGGYEWQLVGTLNRGRISLTGTLSFYDGTSLVYGTNNPLQGCTMWGEPGASAGPI